MGKYKVTLESGDTFFLYADFGQSSSPIRVGLFDDDDDDTDSTPYQVADAGHDVHRAATLAAEYFAVSEEDGRVCYVTGA